MINTQTLKGNLIMQDYSTAFILNQGDKGVPFRVELLENGTPYTLLSDDIVTIEWLKPNGNPFLQEGDIKYGTNYIEFTTPESVAQYSGSGSFNIIISNSDVRKGTIRREYKVVPTSMKPGSVSEDTITDAITELRELSVEIADTVQNNQDLINNNQAATKQDIANVNSSLEEKVADIQIGTRNHLLNTGLKDNASSFSGLTAEVTRVTTMKTPSGNNCFYSKVSNKTNKVWIGPIQEVTSGFSIGDIMTFSIQTYVTNEVATDEGLFVEVVGLASDNSTRTFTQKKQVNASDVDEWVKYELTFVVPANTVKLQCLSYVVKNGSWYTGDYKLEKGNKATDWTPNLKDIDNAIDVDKYNIAILQAKVTTLENLLNG